MKFEDEVLKTSYYTSYKMIPESKRRILESDKVKDLTQTLFDLYNVESIYITGDLLLKESISNTISLFMEIDSVSFVDFLDRRSEFMNENLEIICEVRGLFYKVTLDNATECKEPFMRVLLENERLI